MSQLDPQARAQANESRRLTLTSTSRNHNPLTANIPQFTRFPPPPPNLKPLPKPIKPIKPIKQTKTADEKKREKKMAYRKKAEIAKALKLEKERGPLPESEEGEYDEFGFWVEYEKKTVPVDTSAKSEEDDGTGDQLRLRGGGEGKEDSLSGMEQDNDIAIRQVNDDLQAMASGQAFEDLFDLDKRLHIPPTTQPSQVPAASTAPRASQPKRKRQEEPMTLHDIGSASSRTQRETSQHHPMLDQRAQARHPVSAMRGGAEQEDDQENLCQMPVSAQPRKPSIYPTEYDSQEHDVRLSPTEVNSSAVAEPVSRSQTRRSNDRARVYSLQPPSSTPVATQQDVPYSPPSFAVSDTQPDSPDLPGYIPVPGPTRVRTYAKGSKSAPTRHTTTAHVSRNPADRREFKDQFSPEPEWEEEHLTGVSTKDRSKRDESTSWWPEPDIPALINDQDSESDDDDDDDEEEDVGHGLRHILGEVELNENGHRIVKGRNRNGLWPSQRLKGLFDDDSQDLHKPIEFYRPVSDRLHLVHVKEEPPGTLVGNTPPLPDEIKISRKHNSRANHNHPIVHPAPQLIMRREQSVAGRLDDYTHKVNSRQTKHQAHLPNNPVVHTNIKSRIKPVKKRRSKFEIPNLPASVLKPITTIPADEYRKQLKLRNPGDGFLNPVLIKAGRLGTRDVILKQHQSRIRSTGRSGVKTQTPIVDDMGEPDPIEVIQTQVPREEQPGFAVRQLERVKASQARYQRLRPKLPFTSNSPPLPTSLDTSHGGGYRHGHGHSMRFTAHSPPRPRRDHVDFEMEMEEDENGPIARPALDVPGLVAPKVGFGTKYKKIVNFDMSHSADTASTVPRQGFIRRRPGYLWEPSSGEARGEPIYHNENDIVREEAEPLSTLPMVNDQYRKQDNEDQEPLFLAHEDSGLDLGIDDNQDFDLDLDSHASRQVVTSPVDPENIDTISKLSNNDTGLSGAQLCNTLLQSAARLPLPTKRTSKSRREEKREEMARRIKERDESKTPRPEGVRLTDKVHEYGPLFDELEGEEETGLQPTTSQLKRRAEFGFKVGSAPSEQGITGSTQIGVEEPDIGSTHSGTQLHGLTTQSSSFQPDLNAPPARNPGRSDPTPATPMTAAGTATATPKVKKTTSKFFPPKAIPKGSNEVKKGGLSSTRSGPKWATEEDIA